MVGLNLDLQEGWSEPGFLGGLNYTWIYSRVELNLDLQ